MARRKGELLDLLRKQDNQAGANPSPELPVARPAEAPAAKPSKAAKTKKPASSRKPFKLPSLPKLPKLPFQLPAVRWPSTQNVPWVAVGLVAFLAIPLIWWMANQFGDGTDPILAARPPGGEESGPDPGGRTDGNGEGANRAVEGRWRILAITYNHSQANLELAALTAQVLKDANFPEVKLVIKPPRVPEFIQLYIGSADNQEDLQGVLRRLRSVELPVNSGERPFATARVALSPKLVDNH